MRKKEYKRAEMEIVFLSDEELEGVSGGVESPEDQQTTGQDPNEENKNKNNEAMGQCSTYGTSSNAEEGQGEGLLAARPQEEAEGTEDFFSAGFMGMCSGYDQQVNLVNQVRNEDDEDSQNEIRENCFAYGFMGMCSGYEQQSSLVEQSEVNNAAVGQEAGIAEDCITYGFMGMCSGYEVAGQIDASAGDPDAGTSTQE